MKQTMKNFFLIAFLSLAQAIQGLIALAVAMRGHPPSSPLTVQVFPEWQEMLRPEWEMWQYRFFVGLAIGLNAFWIYRWRTLWQGSGFWQHIRTFWCTEMILTSMLVHAAFKILVFNHQPQLATTALLVVGAVLFVHKCAHKAWGRWVKRMAQFLENQANINFLNRLAAVAMPVVIVILIYVPNVQAVVARFFIGEQFHHNDSFIYGPGLAYVSGALLNIETISQYGFGLPIVISTVGKIFGPFGYENIFKAMMWMVIAYYVLWFILLRQWLKSTALSVAVVFWAIKVQMFHMGVYPFVFTYGSATVLRFWWDIFFFMALWRHLNTGLPRFAWIAAILVGIQLFYLPSEGIYLFATYAFYMLIQKKAGHIGFFKSLLKKSMCPAFLGMLLLPFATAFVLFVFFTGQWAFKPLFWANMGEFIQYFLSGFGVEPIYKTLVDKQFLASLMGFVVPSVYVLTLLVVGTLWFLGRIRHTHIFTMVLCVYGLSLYHYYVARSTLTSYDVVALPYVFIVGFWVSLALKNMQAQQRRVILLGGIALSIYALATTHMFLSYPNLVNVSRNPLTDPRVAMPLEGGKPYFHHLWRDFNNDLKVSRNSLGQEDEQLKQEGDFSSDEDLVAYYRKEADFSQDVALIQGLTSANEPVALIASFEVKMLMDAKRKPFFYYFPLVISRPMAMRSFVRTSIYTTDQFNKTIQHLESAKPAYVFMERIFLTRPVPEYFYGQYSSFMYLTDYILKNYEPAQQGKYLVALKHK